jgi:XTP/dITP diphosphohydrolase|uniref:non-canonical purine NTP pyrophosphatase n=1 Tax=Cephaloticoccus sp. TaxID=1985742 RepID=UPI00404B60E2
MKLYLASANTHKVRELQALADLSSAGIEILSAQSVGGMPEVVEDTGSFVGNARKKAHAIKSLLPNDGWALADDSGICVDALGGAPGVESAYFAGAISDDRANLNKLVAVMREAPHGSRGAHYVCVLVLISPAGDEYVFEGKCHGALLFDPIGAEGFGYDPLFVPTGHDCTFGELPPATKQQLSHRAMAWGQLIAKSY